MPAIISFQRGFLDPLLRGDTKQATRRQTDRIKAGDVCPIYIEQRSRIVDKPVRPMTGCGMRVIGDRVNDMRYNYPAECPISPFSGEDGMYKPAYYAHFLGEVIITEVYDMIPNTNSTRNAWANADGFDNFTCADTWFTKRYGGNWMRKPWTVIRWGGWIARHFEPER